MPYLHTKQGAKIYYKSTGKGTPIIFIHPPLLNSANFQYQLTHLKHSFQIILFDIRGHGMSEPSRTALTYAFIVEDMVQLLDHLAIEQAWIAGYSTGGSIALEFMLRFPHRASGGILISAMSEVNDWQLKKEIQLGVLLAKKRTKQLLTWGISWGNSDCWTTFRRLLSYAERSHMPDVEQYYRYSLSYNCTPQLTNINHPILLAYGADDHLFFPYAKLLQTQLRNVQCNWVPDSKHQLPTKAYQTINLWITEFINTCS